MWIGGDPIDEVGASQLQALVENKVAESRRLEFKLELPGGKDSERKEFLADVSAFANTDGGVLLYGIATGRDARNRDNGIADEIKGVALGNVDGEVRRLSDIIRSGLNPPLTGFRVRPISLEGDLYVVAIGVSRSLLLPHAVWFKKSGKFYKRSDAAKYQVDVSELRSLFQLANEWADQAKLLQRERLQQI